MQDDFDPLLSVLSLHLPLLAHLSLLSDDEMDPTVVLTRMAHPSVRQIELRSPASWDVSLPERMLALNQQLVHSVRLPMLGKISWHDQANQEGSG
jgi:hypothetical protein